MPNQTGIKAREKRAAQRARRKEKKQEKKKEKKAQAKRDKKTKKAPNQLSASNPNLRPDVGRPNGQQLQREAEAIAARENPTRSPTRMAPIVIPVREIFP